MAGAIPIRFILLACTGAALAGVVGCAGYHTGNQSLYRSDIRTVHVAMIETDTFRRFLGQQLTESIIKTIELNSPLTIADPASADSFVQGRLIRERKRILGKERSDFPRDLQIEYRLEISWVDRAGAPLMQRQLLRIDRTTAFVPEGGQSMSTAQQELVERIAREVVGHMEMPW